jgi:hypothetical protein
VLSATWYQLWVNDSLSSSGKIKEWYMFEEAGCIAGIGICSVTPAIVLSNGAAQWWIQAWNEAGFGPWSDVMTFTISDITPPGKVTQLFPSGTIITDKPTYVWNAVSNATWYQIWVNDAADNSGKIKAWYSTSQAGCRFGLGTCSVTTETAIAIGDAQWWVRAWNDLGGDGPWSDGMSFTVARSGPPDKATLISPSGYQTSNMPTFKWNAVQSATWYQLWVSNGSTGAAKIRDWYTASQASCSTGTGTCTVSPGIALNPGAYEWWIRPRGTKSG